ncbi:protein kinase [candidate division GN15 bacterium]|nr:protein kinase [candidate division GN15 bacterium]
MLTPGKQFAHFMVESKIGEGGMGAVYLAEDQKLGRKVALKILLAEYFDDEERRERFYREAKTAAQVSHPNVMGIFDLGNEKDPETGQDLHYIVMEYIPGRSLTSILREGKPEMATILRYASKIASGLSAAHQKGIVHRDIKAENVLIDENDEPKVLDFGLAKPVTPVQFEKDGDDSTRTVSQELTRAGKILGTVTYMSPEQVRGEKVDNRSDIFSFGILLYQMATGEMPFSGQTQVSTLAKILESQPEPPHTRNADIPAELERIIAKCLQKDPADRYQDTRDLVVDLRSLRRQYDSGVTETVSSITDRPAQTSGKTFKVNLTWKLVIVVVVGMFLTAGLIEECFKPAEPERQADIGDLEAAREGIELARQLRAGSNTLAIVSFSNKTGDAELDWLETGLPEIMLTDLSQSGDINIISRERIFDHLGVDSDDSYPREDYVEAAQELGAEKLLSGSFFKVGEQLRIDARLEDITSGTIVLGEKVVGSDPFVLVDSLTMKIAGSLDVDRTVGEGMNVARFASSPEAYKEYHEGLSYFGSGQYDRATAQFEKAIAIDSTFAMPYMRIGMVHVFEGRMQEGAQYLARATRYEDNLPRRDRALLDIYVDLWQRQQLEPAYEKIQRFVDDFPEDKEGRTIYALIINGLEADSAKAFAHLDTVLAMDPDYAFALTQYAQLLTQYRNYDDAIPYWGRLVEAYPESPSYYLMLADAYEGEGHRSDAVEVLREAADKFPRETGPLFALADVYLLDRKFDRVEQLLSRIPEQFADDPYRMRTYYNVMGNLALWRGKLDENIDWRHRALEEALKAGDDNLIWGSYNTLNSYFERYDQPDSALHYLRQSYKVANAFQRVNYPIDAVSLSPETVEEMRPLFERDSREFRKRLPTQMHVIADGVDSLFEAYARLDTAAIIRGIRLIQSGQPNQTGNDFGLGSMLIMTGHFEEGRDILENRLQGSEETTGAWNYLMSHYYLGIAEEGLGNRDEAVEHYREMLRYWNDADRQLDEIVDARRRLDRLTS